MKIIDGVVSNAYQDAVEEALLSVRFPWYLNRNTVDEAYGSVYGTENTIEAPQLTHTFIRQRTPQSEYAQFISLIPNTLMLTENVRTDKPYRVKANLNFKVPNCARTEHFTTHVDLYGEDKKSLDGVITCIYYVNDCDGDTIFFSPNGKEEIGRVSPKKGRIVYFDANIPHAGQPPVNADLRCLINFNFLQKGI